MDMEYKDYSFNVTETKERKVNGVQVGTIEGLASTFGNKDLHDDIVMAGAFAQSILNHKTNKSNIKMLWQHSSRDLIGMFLPDNMEETANGLLVSGDVNLETQKGREAFALAKQGALESFSIGFRIKKFEIDTDNFIRIIKEIDLVEISLVTSPANPEARITNVKSIDTMKELKICSISSAWNHDGAVKRLDEFGESKSAYLLKSQFPVADVVDGSLVVFPKAVFSAAVAVSVSKMELEEKKEAVGQINHLYSRMSRVSPFDKGLGIDELKSATLPQLDQIFKQGVKLNGKAADLITKSYTAAISGNDKGHEAKRPSSQQDLSGALTAVLKLKEKTNAGTNRQRTDN